MRKAELKFREKKGCLTDCVAYIFNEHPYRTPLFVRRKDKWPKKFRAWLKRRGLKVRFDWRKTVPKRGTFIVGGRSLVFKNSDHAVVYRNGKLVYDPSYPSYWKAKRIEYVFRISKI